MSTGQYPRGACAWKYRDSHLAAGDECDGAGVHARRNHQPADELDDAGQAELRHELHLVTPEHPEQLLRPVLGEEQPRDDAKERVDVRSKAPEDSVHDSSRR